MPWGRHDEFETDIAGGPQIENGRTIDALQRQLEAALAERDEARAQQTATAEVLDVINASSGDLEPVFGAMLEKAMHLCEAAFGIFGRFDGKLFEPVVDRDVPPALIATTRRIQSPPANSGLGRLAAGESVVQLVDLANTDIYRSGFVGATALVDIGGARTAIFVALRKEGALRGVIVMYRREVRAFGDKQVALLQNFAAQAVIAMENARLLTEQREALEQQTATADILRVINASPGDLAPVFQAILEKAHSVCGADMGSLFLHDGASIRAATTMGYDPEIDAVLRQSRPLLPAMKALVDGQRFHHLTDLQDDNSESAHAFGPQFRSGSRIRTNLIIPLRKDGTVLGFISANRRDVRPYSDKEIALLENFAAQAVIAMENARLLGELRESLEQQTATSGILRVISQSPTDVTPVLDAVAKAAVRLCEGADTVIVLREGDRWFAVAHEGPLASPSIQLRRELTRETAPGRAMLDRSTVHLPDIQTLDPVEFATEREISGRLNFRATVSVPMLRDGESVGTINLRKSEPGPFSPRQVTVLESFAAQAVIALENTRLFTELRESLDQQTATADILRVISQSPTDVQPVLDVVADAARRFCGASDVVISLREGDELRIAAHEGPLGVPSARRKLDRSSSQGRAVIDARTIHTADFARLDPTEWSKARELSREFGFNSAVAAPLLREGAALGAIFLRRPETGPFSPRQVALLEAFAAQAVIAIENVRLFTELKESLDQQTATADILQVISQSRGDVKPVFDVILAKAMALCEAPFGVFNTVEDRQVRTVTTRGVPEAFQRFRLESPPEYGPGTTPARLAAGEPFVHIHDMADSDLYRSGEPARRAIVDVGGARTVLNVGLRKDDALMGMLILYRQEVRPFSDKQIALLQGFAAQAVIAMENARLLNELHQRTDDLTESLDYQTATSEVLAVISRSPADMQPVLEAMTAAAIRLCGAKTGGLSVRRGDTLEFVALVGQTPEFERWQLSAPLPLERGVLIAHAVLDRQPVQIVDVMATDAYKAGAEVERAVVDLGGHRTILHVPLMREDEAIGVLTVSRSVAEAFTERQIGLIKTFADQAVIAMENARLLGELRHRTDDLTESLEYQTATSQVLEVISRSAGDLQPVLDAMLSAAGRLCGANSGGIVVRRAEGFRYASVFGLTPEAAAATLARQIEPGRATMAGRALLLADIVHADDLMADPEYQLREVLPECRSSLGVPLMRDGVPIGVFVLNRGRVEPFADRQIDLVRTFADQAVIAMENTRLLGELTRREEELRVTFDHMGDGVVMFDAGLKLASWNRNFQELLDIPDSFLAGRPTLEDYVRLLVERGELGADNADEEIARYRERANAAWSTERTRPDGRIVEVRNNPVPGGGAVLIYSDITERKKAEAEIAAARDAAEAALERQTATADILKVIASSPTDVQPVLDVLAKAAVRFCGATDANIHMRDGNDAILVAHEGPLPLGSSNRTPLNRETGYGAAMLACSTIHRPDILGLDPVEFAAAHRFARELGFRAVLVVPLQREGAAIGAISLRRVETGAFTQQQIELLETFAAQAVIAIENVRLFTELRDSLERLKAAQANLVQSEKMASLGQLTAGIAHEIKNPLNFVNNFAMLSVDLLDELKEVAGPALATLDEDRRAELDETMGLLVGNLGKIAEHGKRADGIVRSMLSHSRGGTGDWAPSDINALVEEALNLAYHGARAQDKEFNVTLERDLEQAAKPIDVVPQDVTRVFLNLFGNGFYAANKRRTGAREAGFRPTLRVTTRDLGDSVEVRVRDNGIGMPPEVKEKLFQPFFTTKPTGEGTGLGLSISYDIVTQQHGGTIDVESEPNNYTEFTVRLPRARRVAEASRGA